MPLLRSEPRHTLVRGKCPVIGLVWRCRRCTKITSGYELVVLFLDQLGAARRAYRAAGAGHHPFDRLLNLCDVMPHLRHHRYEAVTTIEAP